MGTTLINLIQNKPQFHVTDKLSSADVVIDFSLPIPSLLAIQNCVSLNKPITIGTTGYNKDQLNLINESSKSIPIHPILGKKDIHYVDVSEFPCMEIDFIEDLEEARTLF